MELPPQVISLIHHIELTESRWWEKAVRRFLIAAVAEHGPVASFELPPILRRQFGIDLSADVCAAHVGAIVEDDDFVEIADGRIKLSERAQGQAASDLGEAQAQQARLEERFINCLLAQAMDVDPENAWTDFEQEFLTPVVRELGARTYELLVAGVPDEEVSTLTALIAKASGQHGADFRQAVIAFLDPSDADVRGYILRALSAYFLVQAATLPADVLDALAASQASRAELRVLLDTNYLFSILELHDNPANEVASAIDRVLAKVRERVAVKLYVLQTTVDEARAVLGSHIDRLHGVRPGQSIARAVAGRPEFTGLAQTYLAAAAESQSVLTPEDFFGPYEEGLLRILKERGVELFNEDIDSYRIRQDVIDDVVAEEAYQKERRSRGPKSYNTILHDMVLWHFVRDKRPQDAESPLEVGYWGVTEDFGLVGFDRAKRRDRGYPTFLMPAALMQLLLFWVPRNEDLDRALVGAIRLPFLFEAFDSDAEAVSTRILRVMSRYEGIGDLSVETITGVLVNQAFRTKIAGSENQADEEVALRAAFVEEAARLEAEKRHLEAEIEEGRIAADAARQELVDTQDEISLLDGEADRMRRELLSQQNERAQQGADIEALRAELDDSKESFEEYKASVAQGEALRALKRSFVWRSALLFLVAALAGALLAWLLREMFDGSPVWVLFAIAVFVSLASWLWFVPLGARDSSLQGWVPMRLISWSGNWMVKLLVALTVAILGGALLELLKF